MNINLTFLGQMIAFAAFLWFCMKYVWPPLLGALEERKEKIRDSLHAADVAKKDLQALEGTMQKTKDDAKKEAAHIVEQARKQAQSIVAAAKQQAIQEANKTKEMAQQDINSQYEQKQEEIKHHIKQVSIALVTKIMSEQFANNAKFDDAFIAQRLSEVK